MLWIKVGADGETCGGWSTSLCYLVHAERSDVAICGIYALTGAGVVFELNFR